MATSLVHQGIIVPKNIFTQRMVMNIRKNNNLIDAIVAYVMSQGFNGVAFNKEDYKTYDDIKGLLELVGNHCRLELVPFLTNKNYIVKCISWELYFFIGREIDLFDLNNDAKIKSLEVVFDELSTPKMAKIPLFEDYKIKTYFGPLGIDVDIEEENDKL